MAFGGRAGPGVEPGDVVAGLVAVRVLADQRLLAEVLVGAAGRQREEGVEPALQRFSAAEQVAETRRVVQRRPKSPNGIIPTLLSFFAGGQRGSWVAWSIHDTERQPNFAVHTTVDAAAYPGLVAARVALSKDEVDRMMREAESHAAEDKRRKEEVETRNQADQAVYGTEKMLREMGEKVSAADRAAIEAAINDVKSATEKNEPAAIKGALERLTAAQHKLAESLYAQSGAAGAPGGAPGSDSGATPGGGAKDDVIDAEVVDEGKK